MRAGKMLWVALAIIAVIAAGIVFWPRNSGQFGAVSHSSEFVKKWEFNLDGPLSAALALADDGTLYAATESGSLFALSSSGTLQWKFSAAAIVAAPVIGEDGTIYFSDRDQVIHAINHTGTERWSFGGGPHANKFTPWRAGAIDANYFYTPWRGLMRGIKLSNGEVGLTMGFGFEDEGSASILSNGLLTYPGAGRLDAVDSTGRTVWQYPVMDPPLTTDLLLKNGGRPPIGNFWLESGIAVGRSAFYAAAAGSRLVAFGFGGTLKWEFKSKASSTNRASPVIAGDGTIYFGCGDGTLYAVDSEGSQKWAVHAGNAISSTPIIAEDGTIFVLSEDTLAAISEDGKLLAKLALPGGRAAPSLAPDGTLYVPLRTGKALAFSTSHGPLKSSSPWPKFQRDAANTGRALPI